MSVKIFFDIPMQFPIKGEIKVGQYKLLSKNFKDGRQDYIKNSNISAITLGDLYNVYCSAPNEYRRVPFGWWLAHMNIYKGYLDIHNNRLLDHVLIDLYKNHHLDPYLFTVLALINHPETDYRIDFNKEYSEWRVTWLNRTGLNRFIAAYFGRMIDSSNFYMWNFTVRFVFNKLGLPDPCIRAVNPQIRKTKSRLMAEKMDIRANEMLY